MFVAGAYGANASASFGAASRSSTESCESIQHASAIFSDAFPPACTKHCDNSTSTEGQRVWYEFKNHFFWDVRKFFL